MSHKFALEAAKQLSLLADQELEVGEQKYGSADEYNKQKGLAWRIDYTQARINTYLECIKAGQGDPAKLLAGCENHLRFLFSKLKSENKIP